MELLQAAAEKVIKHLKDGPGSYRVLGFWGLGFRGFGVLGFWGLGFRVLGCWVLGFGFRD